MNKFTITYQTYDWKNVKYKKMYDIYFSGYNFGLIYKPKTIWFFILNIKNYF